jgi:hypothetical protein
MPMPLINIQYMHKLAPLLLLALTIGFTACKGHSKKILVYASSDIKADETQTNITIGDGTTHHERELDFQGGDPVTLNMQTPTGKTVLVAAEDGYYIANLKNDTIVGSYQHVGAGDGESRLTQDQAKQKLDSLRKLCANENVSQANRNYFIPPGKIVKITAETKAKIFGPFTSIPGSFDAGSVPEIYKFYSVPEVREIIGRLEKMTGSNSTAGDTKPGDSAAGSKK